MEKFKDTIITNAGRKLLIKVGAGEGMITYTKAVLYQQDVNSMEDEDIRNLTTLTGEKQTANVTVTPPEDNTVTVATAFSNKDLKDDVTFNAVGWWAKNSTDNKEILLGISPSYKEQTLAAGSPDGRSTASIELTLNMAISNAAKVDLTVNEIGVAHISDVNAAIERLKTEYDPKIAEAGKVKGARINNGQVVNPDDKGILNLAVESAEDIKNLVQSKIDTLSNTYVTKKDFGDELSEKADKNYSYSRQDIDIKTIGTVVSGYNLDTNEATPTQEPLNMAWLVKKDALKPFADAIKSIKYAPQERRSLGANDDANSIVDTGIYRISNNPIKNGDNMSFCFLIVLKWDDNTIQQYLIGGGGSNFRYRNISKRTGSYPAWTCPQKDTQSKVDNLQNQINDLKNQINYIKDNYVEGKRFPASQESQAQAWENEKPTRLAIIEK